MLSDKVGGDGHEIFSEFVLAIRPVLTDDQDVCTSFRKDSLDEFKGKSTEAVPVLDNHLSDRAFLDCVQKGFKLTSMEVESTANIGVDLVVWVRVLKTFALSREVGLLAGRGDSDIDGSESRVRLLFLFESEKGFDRVELVQTAVLPVSGSDALDLSIVCPTSEGRG